MNRKFDIFVVICTFMFIENSEGAMKKLPSYIKQCSLTDGNTKACLRENMEILRPHFKDGIPEFKIPPLDPLHLPEIVIKLNNFVMKATNINITEATSYKIIDFDFDLETNYMKIDILFPKFNIESIYDVEGRILLLNLKGSGRSKLDLENLTAHLKMFGTRYPKKGKTYVDIKNNTISLEIENGRANFENIFGDNKELNDQTNRVINENIKEFIAELIPYCEEIVGAFIISNVQNVFKAYSLEELYKP